jgi:hypothetical protein
MPVNKFYEVPPIVTTFRGAELNVDTQEGLETVYKGVDAELGDTALNFDACKGCQRGAFLAIARWVESVPDAAEQARQELASAEDSVTSSQAALKSVFHPKV